IAGGRHFLYYETDTVKHTLKLWDKNKRRGDDEARGRRNRRRNQDNRANRRERGTTRGRSGEDKPLFTWKYERPTSSRIILSGLNDKKDSIYVVLDRIDRELPIQVKRSDY